MSNLPIPEWGAQQSGARFSNPKESAMRLTQFERKIRRRNRIEYAVAAFCAVYFSWNGWKAAEQGETIVAFGWLVLIAGITVAMFNLRRIGSNIERSPEIDCRSHLRAQLSHQQRALSSSANWYIGPLVPGMLWIIIAMAIMASRDMGVVLGILAAAFPAALVAAVFGCVVWLNHRAARKLAEEIAQMDKIA